tara:strand:- start:8899 stop:9129 length:231 start_codon:yes stop_codon:yes gene_type:complete
MSAYRDYIEENIDHLIEQQITEHQEQGEDKGLLVCVVCNTSSNPSSEPMEDNDKFIAMCGGCKDWGEFVYESELEG